MFKNYSKRQRSSERYRNLCTINWRIRENWRYSRSCIRTKMMGEGFGINPTEGEVVSPIAGRVDNVFPTKHAIGLKADNGLELLVHIGLDTVQLDGEGFEVLVSSGDEVNVGDPLVRFNLEFINNNAKSVISPIIITNTDQAASINIYDENAVIKGETKVIDVTMN